MVSQLSIAHWNAPDSTLLQELLVFRSTRWSRCALASRHPSRNGSSLSTQVFRAEFGVHPDEAFDEFAREPVASASIAQVHRARLKRKEGDAEWKDGEGWVAVKIRKPSVPLQIDFDLFAYK